MWEGVRERGSVGGSEGEREGGEGVSVGGSKGRREGRECGREGGSKEGIN